MMIKKGVIIASVILVLVIAFGVYLLWPIQRAVKPDELYDLDEPYFFVKWARVTGSDWMIIGDQNGEYSEAKYVVLQGKIPDIVKNYDIATGGNVYVCYGEYIGEEEFMGDRFGVYNSTGWDILYPVKRNAIFPFWPKGYLCRRDVMGID